MSSFKWSGRSNTSMNTDSTPGYLDAKASASSFSAEAEINNMIFSLMSLFYVITKI